jgi:hypothetical protein
MTNHDNNALPELLPCPFCGGVAGIIEDPGIREKWEGPHFIARCPSVVGEFVSSCYGNHTNLWDLTPEDAASRWNRRAAGREDSEVTVLRHHLKLVQGQADALARLLELRQRQDERMARLLPDEAAGREEAVAVPASDLARQQHERYLNSQEGLLWRQTVALEKIAKDRTRPTAPAGNGGELEALARKWQEVAKKQRAMAARYGDEHEDTDAARMIGMAERSEYCADELLRTLAKKPGA